MASASSSQSTFRLGRSKKSPTVMDQIGKFFGGDKKKKGKVRIEQTWASPREPLLLFCLSSSWPAVIVRSPPIFIFFLISLSLFFYWRVSLKCIARQTCCVSSIEWSCGFGMLWDLTVIQGIMFINVSFYKIFRRLYRTKSSVFTSLQWPFSKSSTAHVGYWVDFHISFHTVYANIV